MKVTERIKKEHEEVKELFEQFEKRPTMKLVKQIKDILDPHHYAEEETVFPKVAAETEQKAELVRNLIAEHEAIELLFNDIFEMKVSDDMFESKVYVLQEVVEHHTKEEENVFFEHAKEVYSDAELTKATQAFDQAKEEFSPSPDEG
ncbi:MAG: hemerythrin domain-containing protein [Tissierellia bacterium]|nr:hemerythrin domain-containing protein [Tissierellia bacterium]